MFRRIMLPTDGSDTSLAAAEPAIVIAKRFDAPLQVVYVLEPYPFSGIGSARPAGADEYMAASRGPATLAFERIAQAAAAHRVPCETLTVEDAQAARGIVEAATTAGVDLIVMASHGRSGLAKLVLGSVATKVLQSSPMPVLIVK